MNLPNVSVVIVNWNGGHYLVRCLDSILRQTEQNFECIIVDNASGDDSLSNIPTSYTQDPRFTIIRNSSNLGYCGGSNVGLRLVRSSFVATINPDVLLSSDFLEQIPAAFNDDKIGIIAPCLTRESNPAIIDSAGTVGFPQIFCTAHRAGSYLKTNEVPYETFGAIGAGAVYRVKMLQELGHERGDSKVEFFDEDFFTYYDEHDLQIRAKWLGWKALYDPRLRAQHAWRHSVKSGLVKHRQLYHLAFRNYYLSMIKNMPLRLFLKSIPAILLQEIGILALSLIYRSPLFLSTKLSAIPLIKPMLKKRKNIMAARRISEIQFSNHLTSTWNFLLFLFGVASSEKGEGQLLTFGKSSKINKDKKTQ